jgi:bifunctional enzyme CysN/CysC
MGIVAGSGIGDRGPEHSNSRVSEAAGFSGSPVPGPRSRDRPIPA